MLYQLVIQFPEKSKESFDQLIEIESKIETKLTIGEVDGHDFGQGQMNIFILTKNPIDSFKEVKNILMKEEVSFFSKMKAAYRCVSDEKFTCIWPPSLTEFQVI